MIRILSLLIIATTFTAFGQSKDSVLVFDFRKDCTQNFSAIKLDSTFSNYYISDYKDTIYFKNAYCINQPVLTSPLSFKRRVLNGYAEGFLRVYMAYENYYSILDGTFFNGNISSGSYFEYFNSGKIKTTGQYLGGQCFGVWTYYFENGRTERLMEYSDGDYVKLIECDENGVLLEDYDFVKEKAESLKN